MGVAVGAFTGQPLPSPNYSIWHQDKLPWVQVPSSCVTMDREPEPGEPME